ncbi:immunity 41 family protein [Pseudomonas koreensis]|uniref:Immunity 41 family protein n=1 Tax=Pseudomonas koreensis TaxID=198620 RepID=A0A9X2XFH8_9PSED|nr:immunity 41 family protein [Pseudomonas koreensis]MCU7248005.1 immunity 41 family protein [Pseudomonas koreensis]
MDAHFIIDRNSARCEAFDDDSFIGQLHEAQIVAHDEYWQLEWALYQLATPKHFTQELSQKVFRIFSFSSHALASHFDRKDSFKIRNLKRKQVYEFRFRFKLVFEGFFAQKMPSPDYFSEVNPLLLGSSDD